MADDWFAQNAPQSPTVQVNPKASYAVKDDWFSANAPEQKTQKSGLQNVIDYTTDTLSNIPGSAAKLAGNIGHAVRHPLDTGEGLLNVATGTVQKMNPSSVPQIPGGESDKRPYADAAWEALKNRYGSPHAIAESIRTDPVGVASDISALAGGVSGVARGAGVVADAASLPRVASTAGKVADVAGTVSDVANPLTLPLKGAGAVAKGVAEPLVKSALGLPGKTERYGATPAKAVLEETRGINPATVAESAQGKLAQYEAQLKALPATRDPDLTSARQVLMDAIAKVKAANGDPAAIEPMLKQLTEARPGFGGQITPAGDVAAEQPPADFRAIKQQFGKDYTKFDHAIPLSNEARAVGNQAYHQLASEYYDAVPGSKEISQKMQSLIPAKNWAQRADERAGPLERSVDRATRPTGALSAVLLGLHDGGISGAMKALGIQEALASPTVKMGMARGSYAAGKGLSSPITSRTLNAAGVAGEATDNLPHYAKGGVIQKPTLLVDMASGKPSGVMAEKGPERIVPMHPPRLESPGREMKHEMNSEKAKLSPWRMGNLKPDQANFHMAKKPDAPIPNGESFNSFKRRTIGTLQKLLKHHAKNPEAKISVPSSGHATKLAEAWVKRGAPPSMEIDAKHMMGKGTPGSHRLFLAGGKPRIESSEMKSGKGGIYLTEDSGKLPTLKTPA